MKLKKIRNALLVVLTLALVSASAVAVTWAYVENGFKSKTNVFTNEDIVAELTENNFDGHYPKNNDKYLDNWDEPSEIATHKTGGTNYHEGSYTSGGVSLPGDETLGMNIAAKYTFGTEIPKNPSITNISDTTKKSDSADPTEWVAMTVRYYIPVTESGTNYKYYFDGYTEFKAALAKVTSTVTGNDGFNTTNWTAKEYTAADAGNRDNTVFYYNSKLNNWVTTPTVFDKVVVNSQTTFDGTKVKQSDVADAISTLETEIAALDPTNNAEEIAAKQAEIAELNARVGKYAVSGLIKLNASTNAYVSKNNTLYLETLPEFHIELQGYAIQGDLYQEDGTAVTDITTNNADSKTVKDLLDELIAQDKITQELAKAYTA